jgi:hypothetical protein
MGMVWIGLYMNSSSAIIKYDPAVAITTTISSPDGLYNLSPGTYNDNGGTVTEAAGSLSDAAASQSVSASTDPVTAIDAKITTQLIY